MFDHWSFVKAAELCFAITMQVVPRQYRFDSALALAKATVPLLKRTEAYREQHRKRFHIPREVTLHLILNALTKNGTVFDPRFAVNGYEHLQQAQASGKGILLIGHHAALTVLMIRFLYHNGFDPIVVTPDPGFRVSGTRVTARTVRPSRMFLVQVRSRLERGELVCAMLDRAEHHGRRTIEFSTAAGRVIFAPAMIDVAARSGAQVLFTETHLDGNRLSASIAAPSSGNTATAITDDFIAFVKDRARASRDRRTGRLSPRVTLAHPETQAALVTREVD